MLCSILTPDIVRVSSDTPGFTLPEIYITERVARRQLNHLRRCI